MKEKTIYDLIELWSTWKPDLDYVCPSSVVQYYWHYHHVMKKNKPLFPNSDAHDAFAVFANSKPSAIADISPYVKNELLEELVILTEKFNIKHRSFEDQIIFSKEENILDKIQEALENSDFFSLGILLGYPEEAVKNYMTRRETIKITGKKTRFDENYIKSLKIPNFKPSDDWFVENPSSGKEE